MRHSIKLLSELPATLRQILAESQIPAEVNVHGWLKSVRSHKNVTFAEISDGTLSTPIQAVFKGKGRAVDELTAGSSVSIRGRLENSRGSGQNVELVVDEHVILGDCDPVTYPIQKKSLPSSVLREYAHLRFRTTQTAAVMRLRDALSRDWHDWFEDNDFIHVHTPILTSSDCEGAGEVFTLNNSRVSTSIQSSSIPKSSIASTNTLSTSNSPSTTPTSPEPFFPHPVNLTVSSQLHLESPTLSLSRCYTLSPAFRAEPSQTSRHLSEFYMLEAELAFIQTLDTLLNIVEEGIKSTLGELIQGNLARHIRAREDLEKIYIALLDDNQSSSSSGDENSLEDSGEGGGFNHLIKTWRNPFGRITYTEAINLLTTEHSQVPFEHAPKWGESLSSEHEKWLAGIHFDKPVFITDYPTSLKPFYMLPSPSTSTSIPTPGPTVACFDLLFPGIGEMAGGSLREHRLPNLLNSIQKHGLRKEDYEWYLDLRRFGSVPHGGWGMGWERWICWVTGIGNIRDVVAFPRWKGNCRY